jgi:hypothetical protein
MNYDSGLLSRFGSSHKPRRSFLKDGQYGKQTYTNVAGPIVRGYQAHPDSPSAVVDAASASEYPNRIVGVATDPILQNTTPEGDSK